jgi:hypothetical protein
VELVLNNPFRVLGLPASASSRDISKRISDLETFAELGKLKSYPHDFLELGVLNRSLEGIKDAARKIEQAEGRLFHSFFWFRAGDSVDELALESIAAGSLDEAANLWDKQLGKKSGSKKYTWRLNRSVLHLLNANGKILDCSDMDEALEALGYVIDDDLDESVEDVLTGNEFSLNRDSLWRRVVDEVVVLVQSYPNAPYGKGGIKILDSLWSFPSDARDYASSKILNPLIEEVNEAIKISEDLRSNDDFEALKSKNYLSKVERIILDIKEVLGDDDIRFQAVANAYAEEVCACAVEALNQFNNPKLSYELISWAAELPSYSRIKVRIEDNFETIQGWLDGEEEDEMFGEIYRRLKADIYTLTQAENMLDKLQRLLVQVKLNVGGGDNRYLKVSSACAHYILGFLISTVNSASETFKNTKNLTDFKLKISGAKSLTKRLLLLDLDDETRSTVNTNLETISRIENRLNEPSPASTNYSANSSNNSGKIPAWLWFVGIFILILIFSGK